MAAKPLNNQKVDLHKSENLIEDIEEQNKCFLEASKNGGMWFSQIIDSKTKWGTVYEGSWWKEQNL